VLQPDTTLFSTITGVLARRNSLESQGRHPSRVEAEEHRNMKAKHKDGTEIEILLSLGEIIGGDGSKR
jgi:hypothetical protein